MVRSATHGLLTRLEASPLCAFQWRPPSGVTAVSHHFSGPPPERGGGLLAIALKPDLYAILAPEIPEIDRFLPADEGLATSWARDRHRQGLPRAGKAAAMAFWSALAPVHLHQVSLVVVDRSINILIPPGEFWAISAQGGSPSGICFRVGGHPVFDSLISPGERLGLGGRLANRTPPPRSRSGERHAGANRSSLPAELEAPSHGRWGRIGASADIDCLRCPDPVLFWLHA